MDDAVVPVGVAELELVAEDDFLAADASRQLADGRRCSGSRATSGTCRRRRHFVVAVPFQSMNGPSIDSPNASCDWSSANAVTSQPKSYWKFRRVRMSPHEPSTSLSTGPCRRSHRTMKPMSGAVDVSPRYRNSPPSLIWLAQDRRFVPAAIRSDKRLISVSSPASCARPACGLEAPRFSASRRCDLALHRGLQLVELLLQILIRSAQSCPRPQRPRPSTRTPALNLFIAEPPPGFRSGRLAARASALRRFRRTRAPDRRAMAGWRHMPPFENPTPPGATGADYEGWGKPPSIRAALVFLVPHA